MKLKIALLTCIISLFHLITFSQTITQTMAKADSLMNCNDFINAEILLDRALYFADSNIKQQVGHQTALCKMALDKWSEAALLFKMAAKLQPNDSVYGFMILNQCICLIMEEDYELAKKTLLNIALDSSNNYLKQKTTFLLGLTEIELLNFSSANNYFKLCSSWLSKNDSIFLFKTLLQAEKKLKPSTLKYEICSVVIPGLGQAINGNIKDGINSLLLNGSLLTAFVYTGLYYNFLTSSLFYSFFIPRFYLGGIANAKNIALMKLDGEKKKIRNNSLKVYLTY